MPQAQETKDIAQIIAEAMSQNDLDPAGINVDYFDDFIEGEDTHLGEVPIHLRHIVTLTKKMWEEYYGHNSNHKNIPDFVEYELDALYEVIYASIRKHLPDCSGYDNIKICKNWVVAGYKDDDKFVVVWKQKD